MMNHLQRLGLFMINDSESGKTPHKEWQSSSITTHSTENSHKQWVEHLSIIGFMLHISLAIVAHKFLRLLRPTQGEQKAYSWWRLMVFALIVLTLAYLFLNA